jgi:NTE family protein
VVFHRRFPSSRKESADRPVRRGLVLGGGGVLGAAWSVGAMTAVEEVYGIDLRDCEVILGTSAGSVLAAMLGSGVSVEQLRGHQEGLSITDGPLAGYDWDYSVATGNATPLRPRLLAGSPRSLVRNARRLRQMPPSAVIAAMVPEGRGNLEPIGALIDAVVGGQEWPSRSGIWVSTFNYDFGYRVVFGRDDAPKARISDAVRASCSIPGWYAPVNIDGIRYIDGGTWSSTSADLLVDQGLDEVIVLSPMASFMVDQARDLATTIERAWRIQVTKRLVREIGRLRRAGIEVTVLGPTIEDLQGMGANFMNAARRLDVLQTSLRTSRAGLLEQAVTDEDRARA